MHTLSHPHLRQALKKGRLGQALLFVGPKGGGKKKSACALAEEILGRYPHPDLHEYLPEGKTAMHSMDTIKHLCEEVFMAPFEGKQKVFIIDDAERMLPTSSNALLKTLEEPSLDALLILITTEPHQMLGTLLSRLRRVYFPIKSSSLEHSLKEKIQAHLYTKNYVEIRSFAKELAAYLNQKKEMGEEERKLPSKSDFSALQREAYTKEADGAIALEQHVELDLILELFIQAVREEVIRSLQQQKTPPFDLSYILETIKQVRLSAHRFTPLESVFEHLLLKLTRSK